MEKDLYANLLVHHMHVVFQSMQKRNDIDVEDVECPVKVTIGKKNNIIGKWKLVKSYSPMMNMTKDYSCSNIVYNFRVDGSLHITNDVTDPGEIPEVHSFQLIQKPYLENVMPLTLKIGQSEYGCSIAKESMVINSAPRDGSIQTFVRIE